MKRVVAMLLAATMTIGLVACGSKAAETPVEAPAETEGRARDLFKNDSAENGKNPAITAPKVAPEEMPIILESARGFLKKP